MLFVLIVFTLILSVIGYDYKYLTDIEIKEI